MGVLILQIGGRTIPVTWEENESTAELKRQAAKGNITILLSPYGGTEAIPGPIPNSDILICLQMRLQRCSEGML